MDLHAFLIPPAESARRKGPHDRIVMSSRVRLARNVRDGRVPGWAKNPSAFKILEAIPAGLFAACRAEGWRSTRICLSSVVRLSIDSKSSLIMAAAARPRSSGWLRGILMRSGFFRPAGERGVPDVPRQADRLDITMRSCGPFRRADSAGGMRNGMEVHDQLAAMLLSLAVICLISSRNKAACSKFSVLDGFRQFLLQPLQPV